MFSENLETALSLTYSKLARNHRTIRYFMELKEKLTSIRVLIPEYTARRNLNAWIASISQPLRLITCWASTILPNAAVFG
jgi:hypothetical protein